ncbi:MAG: CxxC-x17-CxxC domain-containing protein [Candidatus Bathyarchaeia archaeon]
MYKIICADCGKEAEVPFKPDETRPVYCRECYRKRRGF